MIEIGKVNNLSVVRENNSGFYLASEGSNKEVFLPPSMAPMSLSVGDTIQAFIYHDTKGGLIATTQTPHAQVGEMAILTAIDVQEFGAFFEWGIDKDLLVPGNEQKIRVKAGQDYVVRVCLEEETNRVFGSTKLGRFIDLENIPYEVNEKVEITPYELTDLGYKVIIDKKFVGLVYKNETFERVNIGQNYQGHVKKVRNDGLIDVSLQVQGFKNLVEGKDKIIEILKSLPERESSITDKSSPEDIKRVFKMSKKSFKKSLGMLYKEKIIEIFPDKIILKKDS